MHEDVLRIIVLVLTAASYDHSRKASGDCVCRAPQEHGMAIGTSQGLLGGELGQLVDAQLLLQLGDLVHHLEEAFVPE